MILACDFEDAPASLEPTHLALMAFSLIAPLVVFLVLPKRLRLSQELRLALAAALRPLAWLASLVEGRRTEAASWGPRLRHAAREMAHNAHPAGPSAEVVRSARLLGRAHALGWAAAAVPMMGLGALTALMIWSKSDPLPITTKFVTSAALPAVVASWLAWIGAVAGAIWAQAIGVGGGRLGRSAMGRGVGGALVGLGYGGFTGYCAGVVAMALFVPAMSLLTGDVLRLREVYPVFGCFGAISAAIGAFAGIVTLAPMAVLAPGARTRR